MQAIPLSWPHNTVANHVKTNRRCFPKRLQRDPINMCTCLVLGLLSLLSYCSPFIHLAPPGPPLLSRSLCATGWRTAAWTQHTVNVFSSSECTCIPSNDRMITAWWIGKHVHHSGVYLKRMIRNIKNSNHDSRYTCQDLNLGTCWIYWTAMCHKIDHILINRSSRYSDRLRSGRPGRGSEFESR